MPIDRANVTPPTLPVEEVDCEPLGGTVTVRGLSLTQQLAFSDERGRMAKPLDGESDEEAGRRVAFAMVPRLLALTVVASDGLPLMDAGAWEAFGAQHLGTAMKLAAAAMRLSGHDLGAARKNS